MNFFLSTLRFVRKTGLSVTQFSVFVFFIFWNITFHIVCQPDIAFLSVRTVQANG